MHFRASLSDTIIFEIQYVREEAYLTEIFKFWYT